MIRLKATLQTESIKMAGHLCYTPRGNNKMIDAKYFNKHLMPQVVSQCIIQVKPLAIMLDLSSKSKLKGLFCCQNFTLRKKKSKKRDQFCKK